MIPKSLMPHQVADFNRAIDGFFALVEWCHGTAIPPNQRASVRGAIVAHWDDQDGSVRALVFYICQLHDTVCGQPQGQWDRLRKQAAQIFRGLFTTTEANGRGRVLATLHQTLELLRPGCTGVSLASPAPLQPPPFVANPQPSAPNLQPSFNPGQQQPALQMPVAAANPHSAQPAQPPWQPAPAQGNGSSMLPDVQRIIRQEETRIQNLMLQHKIDEMRDQMVRKILQ